MGSSKKRAMQRKIQEQQDMDDDCLIFELDRNTYDYKRYHREKARSRRCRSAFDQYIRLQEEDRDARDGDLMDFMETIMGLAMIICSATGLYLILGSMAGASEH